MRRITIMAMSIFLVGFLCAMAQAAEVGKVTYTEGRVDLLASGSEVWAPASEGSLISAGDSIRTKTNSKAEVTFKDKTFLRVAQNSKVNITDYQLDADNGRKSASVTIERGKARAIIAKMKDSSEFRLLTPNSQGAVKGSDVVVFYQSGNSGMLVSEGVLSIFSKAHPETVLKVPAGNAVLVPLEDLPKGPRKYLEVEAKFHQQDTSIPEIISSRKGAEVIRGTITKFTGEVKVTKKGESASHEAKQGEILNEGDRIVTGANGIVEITLDNGNAVYMKPDTDITILKLVIDSKTGEFENLFQADKGDVKARIEGLKGKSRFEVKTPTALCGARGTIMLVHVEPNGSTSSFFEGGNGYTTNLISGDTMDVGAGSGASTDSGGGITESQPPSGDDRAGMDDGFDPNGGTGDSSGGDGGDDLSDTGIGGANNQVSGATDMIDNSENDTIDSGDVVDVPITESDGSIITDEEEEEATPEPTDPVSVGGFYYTTLNEELDADENVVLVPALIEDGSMYNLGLTGPGGDDFQDLWDTWEGVDYEWEDFRVSVDVQGDYSHGSEAYYIWRSEGLYSYNSEGTYTTSDGGAFYMVLGGRADGVEIEGCAVGIYMDKDYNAGIIFGVFSGPDEISFVLDGSESFFVERLFDSGVGGGELFAYSESGEDPYTYITDSEGHIIEPGELHNYVSSGGDMVGEGYYDYGDGTTVDCRVVSGITASIDAELSQDWGVWVMSMAGKYSGCPSYMGEFSMDVAGMGYDKDLNKDSSWLLSINNEWYVDEVTGMNKIDGSSEGVYIDLKGDGRFSGGALTRGQLVGNYVDIDPEGTEGKWQAVSMGEWIEAPAYINADMADLISDIDDAIASESAFTGLNNNIPITVAQSATLGIIEPVNNIITADMNMRCLETFPDSNIGIWIASVIGTYSAAPELNQAINLAGDANSATLTFTSWDSIAGQWRGDVAGTLDGGSGVTRDFSGIAAGAIIDCSNFSGSATGTWEKTASEEPR